MTEIIAKWDALSGPIGARVVGTHTEDILGDESPRSNRSIETPMASMVADAILWGTEGAKGGAQIAFMNVGGVRESLPMAPKYAEGPGQITYAEAFDVAPFGNLLNTLDMTGAQIKAVLEQQYRVSAGVGSTLSINVSEGFTYTWTAAAPAGSKVSDMKLDGVVIDPTKTYRVGTLSFLAQGGDGFSVFKEGKNLLGGPEDLSNLVAYFESHPGLTAPDDRVAGL